MTLFTFLAATIVDPDAAGPIETIAKQFGVDWWKLLSQVVSFSIVCFVLQKFAYQPILQVLEERRNKIAQGLKDAVEQKKQLSLAQEEAHKIKAEASAAADKMIEEARAAAKSLQERESQRATVEAEQIVSKARDAAAREKTKMLAELKREVSRLVINTTTKVSGKVLTATDQKRLTEEVTSELAAKLTMKIHKEARTAAKSLFMGSFSNGCLDEEKVQKVVKAVARKKPRHFLEILQAYQRSVRLELEKRSARVESATELDKETRDGLRRTLRSKYGKDLSIEFQTTPQLIGGLRIKIGSDVLDSTIQARLHTLETELLHA